MRIALLILLLPFTLFSQTPERDDTRLRDGAWITYWRTDRADTAWLQSQETGFLFYTTDSRFDFIPAGGSNSEIALFSGLTKTECSGASIYNRDTINSWLGANCDSYLNVNTGSVGVGTANPNWKLDVYGDLGVAVVPVGTNDSVLIIENQQVKKRYLDFTAFTDTSYWDRTGNYLYPEVLTDSVGIGIATPDSKLHVYEVNDSVSFKLEHSVNPAYLELKKFATAGGSTLKIEAFTTTGFSVINMSPISGDPTKTQAFNFFRDTKANAGKAEIRIFEADSSNNRQSLLSANSDSYLNNISGNVGIGTTAPDELLHVDGNIEINNGDIIIQNDTNLIRRYKTNWFLGSQNTALTSGTNNTFVGFQAGLANTTGYSNTAMGEGAFITNTTGFRSVLIGADAGASGNVSNVTAVGYKALENNITANNVALGYEAGKDNTTGSSNTFIGYSAGSLLTAGSYNIFIGSTSGQSSNGDYNTAIGVSTLTAATTAGDYNTAIGYQALTVNSSGTRNTSIGSLALASNTTGTGNVSVGYKANNSNTTGNYNVMIGYSAGENETGDSLLYIENSNSASPLIYGNFSLDSLAVNGTITCDSIYTVKSTVWADYVFKEDYNLIPFKTEIEWIKNNGHLRSLQKANKDKYITSFSLQRRLEGTIEEVEKLYLYIEQLEKRISELEI